MRPQLRDIVRSVLLEAGGDPYDPKYVSIMEEIASYKGKLSVISSNIAEQRLFIAVAICIAGNESVFGTSDAYMKGTGRMPSEMGGETTDVYKSRDVETFLSYAGEKTSHSIPFLDPTIGLTQIRFSNLATPEMQSMKSQLGIKEPEDMQNPAKSIIATAAYLHTLYVKAQDLGYSTRVPGVNVSKYVPEGWKSTGNAALDLAIASYNSNPDRVLVKWCGNPTDPNDQKMACDISGATKGVDVAKNYIPYLEGDQPREGGGQDQPRGTLRYISVISARLPRVLSRVMEKL